LSALLLALDNGTAIRDVVEMLWDAAVARVLVIS
jgi:hypothetical protein